MKVLLLGGTTEAAQLARSLTGVDLLVSWAGRTSNYHELPGRLRVGGFGGAEGLAETLRSEAIDLVIDATHPFAARISAHAEAACAAMGVPRLAVVRPAWSPEPKDVWIEAESMRDAALHLPTLGRRAFLAVGRQELAAFSAMPEMWFLVRVLVPEALPLVQCQTVIGRGPFSFDNDLRLLSDHAIEVVVSKNSGGTATSAKLAAARALSLPVLMVRRPPPPAGPLVGSVAEALAWVASVR